MHLFLFSSNKNPILSILRKGRFFFGSSPTPFSKSQFADLEYLRTDIRERLAQLGLNNLTHIQEKAIPKVFQDNSNFVLAETGSGKTLIYLLPLINDLYNQLQKDPKDNEKPRGGVIFTSSKELSAQIFVDLKKIDVLNKLRISRLGSVSQLSMSVRNMVT